MLAELVYKLGIALRNPGIFSSYEFLKRSESWSIKQLHDHQIRKCRELLQYADQHSPFYHRIFKKSGLVPDDFSDLDQLHKLPLISKQDLMDNYQEIIGCRKSGKSFRTLTSGTTGQPFIFYRDAAWDAAHRAAIYRGLSWFKVKPWNKSIYLGGYNITPEKRKWKRMLDLLQNQKTLYTFTRKEVESIVNWLKSTVYIEGYSSMINGLTGQLRRMGKEFSLKLVKGTGDTIFPAYAETCRQVFKTPIISEYGAAETGIIAFECPQGNLHVTMENVIVEIIDQEVVVTNLVSGSFPVIRYRLNDYVENIENEQCSCGMAHRLIGRVSGRILEYLYGKTETYHGYLLYNIAKSVAERTDDLFTYQNVQRKIGEVVFILPDKVSERTKKELVNETRKYFGADMDCLILDNTPSIGKKGKYFNFIGIKQYQKLLENGNGIK